MRLIPFKYNSTHKIIIAMLLVAWAVFHFSRPSESGKVYSNGQIKYIGAHQDGRNEGHWIWYYENGNKRLEGDFQRGKRSGVWKTYDQRGRLLTEGTYANDQLDGVFVKYDGQGRPKVRLLYRQDAVVDTL